MNESIPVSIVDVFMIKPFEGNPAGVILEASFLTKKVMQSVAKEMNL